ncbi:sulfite exporter TauE/SafE family protein [Microbacterium sp. H83]|uniref:sulfite exporter TauE/SafE family protein n=1 Tax=Microbacterium sp. H83 TaxID=1827324 RepID=UPI0007F49753|nr:sulfite exporter TauE/SafE family protein [Microbacterium sp. H83]OAN33404.1 permease [Microbacterium sp. H83]
MTPLEVALLAAVILAASCLQGSIGFGMGMLAAPFIALIDASLLPVIVIMLATVVTLIVAVMDRAALDLRGAGWALAGRVPGTAVGAWLVAVMSTTLLSWAVAVVVLLGVVVSLRGWRPRVTRTTQAVAGALSGVMGTTTSVGGAPMAIIWQSSEGPRLRGTMSAFFLVGSSLSLVALFLWGAVPSHALVTAGWMAPVAIVGVVLSRYLNRFLNRRRTRAIALGASALGALTLIATRVVEML